MDYLIPVIIISIILSLCMIITSIVILRNSRKNKHTPADTIKPIVDQLAAIHKYLDTIRRNSVNTERNIATIKNSINTINSSQVTDYYLSQTLSFKDPGTISQHTPDSCQKFVTSAPPTQRGILYRHIYSLVQETETIASQIKAERDIPSQQKRRIFTPIKTMYQGTIIPIIEEVILVIDPELHNTLDKLKKSLSK